MNEFPEYEEWTKKQTHPLLLMIKSFKLRAKDCIEVYGKVYNFFISDLYANELVRVL